MKREVYFHKAVRVVSIVIICIAFSVILSQLMVTGLMASNMLFALSAGHSVTGTVTDKIETRGTYRLIIDVDAYDTFDYPCSVAIYSLYDIGDTVTLDVNVVVM